MILLWPLYGVILLIAVASGVYSCAKLLEVKPNPIELPRRVPGHALAGEQIEWDMRYSDVDVWEALYGVPAHGWGLSALTEATAPHQIVTGTVYEGASA